MRWPVVVDLPESTCPITTMFMWSFSFPIAAHLESFWGIPANKNEHTQWDKKKPRAMENYPSFTDTNTTTVIEVCVHKSWTAIISNRIYREDKHSLHTKQATWNFCCTYWIMAQLLPVQRRHLLFNRQCIHSLQCIQDSAILRSAEMFLCRYDVAKPLLLWLLCL